MTKPAAANAPANNRVRMRVSSCFINARFLTSETGRSLLRLALQRIHHHLAANVSKVGTGFSELWLSGHFGLEQNDYAQPFKVLAAYNRLAVARLPRQLLTYQRQSCRLHRCLLR